jgi:UDP-GlcNAc:undecaprenyl-phosphate GlcNAc-1-phosphate transferase
MSLAFLLAVLLTALLTKFASRYGWVSCPRQDRWNVRVVALYGGIPFLLAASAAVLGFFRARQTLVLLLLTWGMALIGFTDDVAKLPPRPKLLGQIIMAGLAVLAGIVFPLTPSFWFNAAFTVFWIVGITNALNLLDNMDGLTAGVAIVALAAVVLLAGAADPIRGLALCLLAAIAGFLVFNVNPAKVFMGDVGALSIGFFLACACVKISEPLLRPGTVLLVPCLIMFIPIFDTLLVSVTRRANARPISLGARDHTSHRLVFLGMSERQAAALLWLIGAIAAFMGFLGKSGWGGLGTGIVALSLMGGVLFWFFLAQLELPESWLSPGAGRVAAIPKGLQQAVATVFLTLIDAGAVIVALYFAYLAKYQRLDRGLLGGFLFAAVLALAFNLPLLMFLAGYGERWRISRRRGVYVLFVCAVMACLLMGFTAALLRLKTIDSSVIFLDGAFTFLLVMLCRGSGGIFESLFKKQMVLDQPVAPAVSLPRLEPAGSHLIGPADPLVSERAAARDVHPESKVELT